MSVAECCLLALSTRFTDLDTWNRLTRRAEENICMQSRCAFMCVFRVDQLSDGHEVTGMDCLVAGRGWLPIELLYNIYRVPGSVFFFFRSSLDEEVRFRRWFVRCGWIICCRRVV